MNNQLNRSAYHEAGHILIAYLVGYKCDNVKLNVDADGNAYSKFSYGIDLYLITALTNYVNDPDIFNDLDKASKNRSFDVGNRTVNMLLAGSVTETLFLNDFKTGKSVELELSGPDLLRSQEVHTFMSRWNKDHAPDYINNTLAEQFEFYQIPEFINTLHALAKET